MNSSIFLAKVIGPYIVIASLGILLKRHDYQKIMDDFENHSALILFGAMIALLCGLMIVNTHNIWKSSWVLIITIFGWISLIKGVCLFLMPDKVLEFSNRIQGNDAKLNIQLVMMLVLGAFLTYQGYFH